MRLLVSGTMVYFGMTSESTSEAINSLPKDVAADFRFTDLDVSGDGLSVEDLLTYVYPEEAGSLSSGNGIADDFRFTDLDVSADGLSVEDLLTCV